MSYLGKEYKFVSQENFEAYVKAIGMPEPDATSYIHYRPSLKLEKNGNEYKIYSIAPEFSRDMVFKSGVEIDDSNSKYSSKSTFTVDGNTVTKAQKLPDGKILTTKKEYSGDSMVETYTASHWDGVAKRFYKA